MAPYKGYSYVSYIIYPKQIPPQIRNILHKSGNISQTSLIRWWCCCRRFFPSQKGGPGICGFLVGVFRCRIGGLVGIMRNFRRFSRSRAPPCQSHGQCRLFARLRPVRLRRETLPRSTLLEFRTLLGTPKGPKPWISGGREGDDDDGGGGDGGKLPASPTTQPTWAGISYPVRVPPRSE